MAKTAKADIDPVDGGLLATLDARRTEYGPVLAYEFGLEHGAVERRCRRLVDRGLVDRVTEEPLYRLTLTGERFLERRAMGPSAGPQG